jgi:hypothetical protein
MIKHKRIKIVVSVVLLSLMPAPVFAIDNDGQNSFREREPNEVGAVRFDTKAMGGPAGEDPERVYNYIRLVRDAGIHADKSMI